MPFWLRKNFMGMFYFRITKEACITFVGILGSIYHLLFSDLRSIVFYDILILKNSLPLAVQIFLLLSLSYLSDSNCIDVWPFYSPLALGWTVIFFCFMLVSLENFSWPISKFKESFCCYIDFPDEFIKGFLLFYNHAFYVFCFHLILSHSFHISAEIPYPFMHVVQLFLQNFCYIV